ncbi:12593_t:CDS:1, partial [Entrophospora sp. SA101]
VIILEKKSARFLVSSCSSEKSVQVYGKYETPISKQRSVRPKKYALKKIIANNNRIAAS